MKLVKLILSNFQGIRDLEVVPDGMDLDISGANGTGKTTIANALSWLLTGKPSTDEKNYSPKSKDSDGDDIHGLNHVAEAVFDLENGETLSLKKDYHEESVGKKTRSSKNSVQKTVSGPESNVTDYYIDGVKVLQQTYNEKLASLFSPEQALMLTLPHYFSEKMKWQDRRDILTSIAGSVSDDEVIKAYSELSPLAAKLPDPVTGKTRSVEEYRSELLESVKVNSKELQTIQPRIDEAEKAKPDLTGKDKAASEKKIADLRKQRESLALRKSSLTEDDALIKNREALAKTNAEIAELKAALLRRNDEANASAREAIRKLNAELNDATGKADDIRREISTCTREKNDALLKKEELEAKLQKTKAAREKAVEELKVLNAKTYQPTPEPENTSICPHCGQRLPDHMLKDAHEAYLKAEEARKEAFLQELEKEKAEVIKRGKACSGDVIKTIETELSAIGDRITELEDSISSRSSELDKAKAHADRLESDLENARKTMKAPVAFEDTEEGKALLERKDVYQKAVDEGENGMAAANAAIDSEISEVDKAITEEESVIYGFSLMTQQEKRIQELQQQEKDLKDMLKEMDEMLKLTERFTELRAEMFSHNINQHFSTVRFILFEKQINGGIRETCEARVKSLSGWMDWSSASSAEKINGGLEIINVLSDHYGVHLPIVIDNAEAVCSLAKTSSQQIRLRVNENDAALRIETSIPAPSLRAGA